MYFGQEQKIRLSLWSKYQYRSPPRQQQPRRPQWNSKWRQRLQRLTRSAKAAGGRQYLRTAAEAKVSMDDYGRLTDAEVDGGWWEEVILGAAEVMQPTRMWPHMAKMKIWMKLYLNPPSDRGWRSPRRLLLLRLRRLRLVPLCGRPWVTQWAEMGALIRLKANRLTSNKNWKQSNIRFFPVFDQINYSCFACYWWCKVKI